jgi:RluA family pseudouridine synthase
MRRIRPYYHTNKLFVKGRWLNRTILDVIVDEFKTRDKDYYLDQINKHRIQIIRDNVPILGDTLLDLKIQNKDILQITLHKHEPPVLNHQVDIIHDSSELLVVNKPSSIPVHPTGRYYYNSLTETLRPSYGPLYLCHRLDKLTSGIVILSKSSARASQVQRQIREKSVIKQYLARVKGEFPQSITCDEAVRNLDTKVGYINGCKPRKEATTIFYKLKYNELLDESLVLCQPLTGRTHQIRIHLNYLSHPIVNDPLYGPDASQIRHRLIHSDDVSQEQFQELIKEDREKIKDIKTMGECVECGEVMFKDQDPQEMVLWLHAYRYKFQDDEFETAQPSWCDI